MTIPTTTTTTNTNTTNSTSTTDATTTTTTNTTTRNRLNTGQSFVLQGEHCQFIDFAKARSSGSGCVDGTKMVVKNKPGHCKQFLIADSRTIYGFVEKGGKKFATDCSSYTD